MMSDPDPDTDTDTDAGLSLPAWTYADPEFFDAEMVRLVDRPSKIADCLNRIRHVFATNGAQATCLNWAQECQMLLPRRCSFAVTLALALLAVTRPAVAETFTIAVVPDPQHYSDVTTPQPRGADTFALEMQYLADSRAAKNLVFTSFVGDIVQHGDGRFREAVPAAEISAGAARSEWATADRAIGILGRSGLVFGMAPGNHDYDNYSWWTGADSPGASRPLTGGATWDHYFGPRSRFFANKSWYGGAFNQGLNSFQVFTGGGRRFLHLSFEMEPPQTVLDWAQQVIAAHPGLPVIISTHEWLLPVVAGAPPTVTAPRSNGHQAYFPGSDHLTPDAIWDRFITKNPAIFLVLCGHNYIPAVNGVSNGENLRIDRNDAGYPVYQVLQDYQGNTVGPDGKPDSANGGAGWLRFITFDTLRRTMHFSTYSPLLHRSAGRDGEATFGIPARYSDFELEFPPQLH